MGFFENIFPLIVIYIIWKVISKAQKAVPPEEAEQPQAAQPVPPGEGGARQAPLNVVDLLRLFLQQGEQPLPDAIKPAKREIKKAQPRPATPGKRTLVPPGGREGAAARPVVRMKEPTVAPAKKAAISPASSAAEPVRRNRLQEAVIWAEILDRPVSLRDE